ncbi:outer membrane protein assembly factor BamE [Burkholderia sp. WAC0059]|uniref:outer membrane protein assembly factor BamE n=1 Tax=Burkholderia sp. WAC0059 TaxID=2066022 RepID=UPI000C7F0FAE|nr:outer membrane protein assembly factor BamE [Burkholderia sp. WAC0059]PLZ03494.1 outer membrane protein assembly factor BamE [Burkholderia sp. WAC0059]
MIPESRTISRGGRFAGTVTGTLLAAALTVLAGCSAYDSATQRIAQHITPYRITIVQGNFVSREAAAQMHVGMTRAQVRQVLGTPLLTDMFHANRWDYVFYFKRGSTSVVQQRDLVVYFNGDNVASWTGGEDLPSNLELLAEIDGDKPSKKKASAHPPNAASAAVAAAAASAAGVAAIGPVVTDTARTTTPELGAATAALPVDANAEAADAANRATSAVQTPPAGQTPSVRSNVPNVPSAGDVPYGSNGTLPQQIQLHRAPPPGTSGPPVNPVGPAAGSQGTGSTSGPVPSPNTSLAAPPDVSGSGTGN